MCCVGALPYKVIFNAKIRICSLFRLVSLVQFSCRTTIIRNCCLIIIWRYKRVEKTTCTGWEFGEKILNTQLTLTCCLCFYNLLFCLYRLTNRCDPASANHFVNTQRLRGVEGFCFTFAGKYWEQLFESERRFDITMYFPEHAPLTG